MKTVKMFQANGAWYAKTSYGYRLLRKTGLKFNGFLSLKILENHLTEHNIKIEIVEAF